MFDVMRPVTILINLCVFVWFCMLQYYRFRSEGMACSGDYLVKVPEDYDEVYLRQEGRWFLIYIVAQYVIFVFTKVISVSLTNKLEAEFQENKLMKTNQRR